jgi:regulator of telomere elongation helicase 1
MLCGVLAWRETLPAGDAESASARPKVYFASRTHAQLAKAEKELQLTSYRPRVGFLGSRGQLCLEPSVAVQRGGGQAAACRRLVAARRCKFYAGVDAAARSEALRAAPPRDLEDLLEAGRTHRACPYFLARQFLPVRSSQPSLRCEQPHRKYRLATRQRIL